ncbi:hypothetical protein P4O66_012719 [Electrophorus voltai]|uniref:Ig-like domain-containing protein n=1 Tax=Electrophorus voltai TaxID=2609070 RepID=A0AAD8Z459_9TELE|nr:hypothetical protein P4O66_012719 [Electrophorus voltai]
MKTWFQCTQWTLLFICVSDVFISAAGSSTSTERVVVYSTVGKSFTFPTRVPLTGTIQYEGRNIGVVLNKNTDTETDEKFKNRLHWDNQTGLFTLSDLRTEDSGGYTVESSKESKIKQEYQLEVYKNVPAPQVTSSNSSSDNTVCSLLCSVINGRGLVLFWYKDNFILNRTSSSNLNAILHLPLEIEKPKNENFICVVSNPVSNKTTTANITTLCYHSPVHGDGRQRYIVGAVLSGFSVVAVIGVAVYLRRRKWQKESSQHTEGRYLSGYALWTLTSSAPEGPHADLQYSEIAHKTDTQWCSSLYDWINNSSSNNSVFLSLDVFISAAGSSTSTERVVVYSTVGKSFTFHTRVPLTGTIQYEGRNIGVVLNKNTDTETDEKFKNRLHWDNQTGLFTLSDLRTEDSGGYTVESSKESKIKQEYQLEVYKNVAAPQVTSSSNSSSDNTVCSLLCSVISERGLVLFWYKDNFILNRTVDGGGHQRYIVGAVLSGVSVEQ